MTDPVQIRDPRSGSTAKVAAHLGFNCYEFQAVINGQAVDVIDSSPDFASGNERPSGHGIPILFPFPNRIRAGRFTWDGHEYHLPESCVPYDGSGNAIHGFSLDRPWRVVKQGEKFVTGEFQLSVDAADRLDYWPADFLIQMTYSVKNSALIANVKITNPDDNPLPWGFGTHAYFRLPLSSESNAKNCLMEAPVGEEWVLTNCLPTGQRRAVSAEKDLREGARYGEVTLDDVYTGLPANADQHETLIYDEFAGLQISQKFGPEYRELVVYTPPNREAVCLEPYTCVTDAVNLQGKGIETGWRVLEPGGEFSTTIVIEAGPVIV